jgi:hypothetical protein
LLLVLRRTLCSTFLSVYLCTASINMTATEAFPLLSNADKLGPLTGHYKSDAPRSRRRSSGLGGEIRAGDTSAPALATLDVRPPSPGTLKVKKNRRSALREPS